MKKNIVLFVIIVLLLSLVSCDMGNDNKGRKISTYFISSNNVAARSISDDTIEFFVSNLLFGHDSGEGSTWIIGFPPSDHNNGGWYDINGINKAEVFHHGSPQRSSLMRFSIKGIRINDKVYSINQDTGTGTLFIGDFVYDNNNQFDIIAGDITKPGNQFINPSAPVLPMDSIPNMHEVTEFILVVDESKLHTNGVLNANWWECFSFIIK